MERVAVCSEGLAYEMMCVKPEALTPSYAQVRMYVKTLQTWYQGLDLAQYEGTDLGKTWLPRATNGVFIWCCFFCNVRAVTLWLHCNGPESVQL